VKKGVLFAIGAYLFWGVFPIYWKWLHSVPALQILGHRIGWSFIFCCIILFVTRGWKKFREQAFQPKTLRLFLVAAVVIAINWLTYIWAVNAKFIVETSLGYFINPLLSVLLGVIFFRERLRPMQWLPIVLAFTGVAYLTIAYGRLPWIALLLAFSFGTYGLIKKSSPLNSIVGMTLETGILFLAAVGYLTFAEVRGEGAFLHTSATANLLLICAGPVTTIPLLMFASAARRIPLSWIGILQYIAPTMQFLIGVFIYHEDFDHTHWIGFGIVWIAVLFFWGESLFSQQKMRLQAVEK
jgi:chloramphenicol-sensitive protein RarD